MNQPYIMRNFPLLRRTVYCCSTLSLLLTLGQASWANDTSSIGSVEYLSDTMPITAGEHRVYTPPPNARRSREDHTGGGVRGCGEAMAAIAPRLSAIGKTASTRPTFVWYVFGDDTAQLEFHLYRYQPDNALEEILITPIGQSQSGYMAYRLPPDQAALNTGDVYLWQVVLYCDQKLAEVGSWTSAEIEIVEPPVSLVADMPGDSLQRAKAYARSGLWYDAIAEVYDATTPEERSFRQNLLLDLADLDDQPSENVSEIDISAQLRQIAEMQ